MRFPPRPHPDGRQVERSADPRRRAARLEAHRRLRRKLEAPSDELDLHPPLFDRALYVGKDVPVGGTAHQAGTLRFGTDPATSVLDTDCKAHELDNPNVTDTSFFPSIGAVNPTLTIIANALRVAARVTERMGRGSWRRPFLSPANSRTCQPGEERRGVDPGPGRNDADAFAAPVSHGIDRGTARVCAPPASRWPTT